jgi:gliding motility-associated-like protein
VEAQTISHSLCANDPRVKRYFVDNPVPGMNYSWNVSGGGAVLPSTSDTLYVNWDSTPGIYEVSLYGVLNATCETDTAHYFIEILPVPSLHITGNSNVCAGEKITLNATGTNQIVWSNGVIGNTSEYFPTTPTTVWARGFDGTCFSDTTYFNLTPVPLPTAAFSSNPSEGEAPLTVSFFNQSTHASNYTWNLGNGVFSTEQNPSTIYQNPGNYTVSLVTENAAGCSDSVTFEYIVVNEAFSWFIPNSFTPNGDGLNESFKPYFPDFVAYTLYIFDRWGDIIFQSTSVSDSWYGEKKGKPVQQGIYTYRVVFRSPTDNKEIEKIGSVAVIR